MSGNLPGFSASPLKPKICIFCGNDIVAGADRLWLRLGKWAHRSCDACPECGAKASANEGCDHRDWQELGR